MELSTACLHAGYNPKNGESRVMPICQSTTFKYNKTQDVADLFDLKAEGFFYSRLSNPTVDYVEKKIAALEGGVGALCTSSGQAATFVSILTLAKAGDHVISTSSIYGGTYNLFAVTFKRFGIDISFVDQNASDDEIAKHIKDNTKAIFAETIANPSITVLDIEKFANIAHKYGLPLIIDNTFATPYLCKPFDFGADIVVHSTTKYLDGHATTVGGVVVDSGNFKFEGNPRFDEFNTKDESYHGLIYTKAFGKAAYIVKARAQIIRDIGCAQTPQGAFYINLGLETLPLRMEKHSANALEIAKFLKTLSCIEDVFYPGLESDKYYALAQKYLSKGQSGVISFVLKGGRDIGAKFIDALKLTSLQVHVADIRTCVLHPASSTHRQLDDISLEKAGIKPGLVRLSVGLEDVKDIIYDLKQALSNI